MRAAWLAIVAVGSVITVSQFGIYLGAVLSASFTPSGCNEKKPLNRKRKFSMWTIGIVVPAATLFLAALAAYILNRSDYRHDNEEADWQWRIK
jgi:hypothetical protein